MAFHRRLTVVAILMVVAVAVYGISRYYSATLVAYVVEQTLLQKLPPEADPALVRRQFHGLLSSLPSRQAKLEKLLLMSQYMEKLQTLTERELEELLGKGRSTPRQSESKECLELSPRAAV